MASLARNPRDILLDTDAEYQRLAEQHAQYESELQKSPQILTSVRKPSSKK